LQHLAAAIANKTVNERMSQGAIRSCRWHGSLPFRLFFVSGVNVLSVDYS
jgi:hypothetical protein